jgi:hypothetical protein
MPPLERAVVKKLLERLRSRGGFWIKLHGSPFITAGLPDIIGCYRGRFIAFEVKRDEHGKPTRLQLFYLGRIRDAGGVASLIHTVEAAEATLDRIDEGQEVPPHQS